MKAFNMKLFFIFSILFLLFDKRFAVAKTSLTAFEINFEKGKTKHTYKLTSAKDANKESFSLSLYDQVSKKLVNKTLTLDSYNSLRKEANRIVWENKRAQSGSEGGNCTEYATIKLKEEASRICLQRQEVVGQLYGFLNSLSIIFEQ